MFSRGLVVAVVVVVVKEQAAEVDSVNFFGGMVAGAVISGDWVRPPRFGGLLSLVFQEERGCLL